MKCGVITLVTKIDDRLIQSCVGSVNIAIENGLGPFSSIEIIPISLMDETSRCRTAIDFGVKTAVNLGCDWIFFLSSREMMFVDAFKSIADLVAVYDIICGRCVEAADESLAEARLLPRQSWEAALRRASANSDTTCSPYTGFFIRTEIVIQKQIADSTHSEWSWLLNENDLKKYRILDGSFILYIKIYDAVNDTQISADMKIPIFASQIEAVLDPCDIPCLEIDSDVLVEKEKAVIFTVGTLVTDRKEYDEMLKSFKMKGFSGSLCEFIYIDNSKGNKVNAYDGLNRILNSATGKYVILCHQDIHLFDDDIDTLQDRLAELDKIDQNWALAGNAGGLSEGFKPTRITDPHGTNRSIGIFPVRVSSLDENFMIVRRGTRVSFSNDLKGFHFYGTDICLNADMLGYSSYVIDFHLAHLSGGKLTGEFFAAKKEFEQKWGYAIRSRIIQTSCTIVDLVPPAEKLLKYETTHDGNNIHIYQIFYDEASKNKISDKFTPLDNTLNLRPDWFEFWPIKNMLERTNLQEDSFYGFLSPNFEEKTGFTASEVRRTVNTLTAGIDVVLLTSSAPDLVFFKNPFLHGDEYHPGLLSLCQSFFASINHSVNLRTIVANMDSSVFSNYIVAKPVFWKKWLSLTSAFFEYAENENLSSFIPINTGTTYKDGTHVQMKVFIMERLACYLLATEKFSVFVPNYFRNFKMVDNEIRACVQYLENLKTAYLETHDIKYLNEYDNVMKSNKIKLSDHIHNLSHIPDEVARLI